MNHTGKILLAGYVDGDDPQQIKRLTGGILYDFMVAKKFAAAGWDVEYFNLESLPRLVKMLKLHSAYSISCRCSGEFDLLMTDLGNSALTLGLQRKFQRQGIPSLLVCHHFRGHLEGTLTKRLLYNFTEKMVVREADIIIANSVFTVGKLIELGRDPGEIILAPPGLNIQVSCTPQFRDDANRLLLVGNVEERKGIIEAVRALKHSASDDAELYVAGERSFQPGYLELVENCIRELGVGQRVHLLGRLSDTDLKEQYELADIFILPSYWEGYGMAIAEALAHGLPVISTTAGAIPDIVKDGVSGVLLEPGDWQNTGKAINRMLNEPDLRKNLAEGALLSAAGFPSWDETTSRILEGVIRKLAEMGRIQLNETSVH